MNDVLRGQAVNLEPQGPRRKALTGGAILSVLGLVVFLSSEIWLLVAGAFWALDGMFGLGLTGDLVLGALIVPPALWATYMVIKLSVEAERASDD
jgi:hypothetical protein